jgi:hypothetical protein
LCDVLTSCCRRFAMDVVGNKRGGASCPSCRTRKKKCDGVSDAGYCEKSLASLPLKVRRAPIIPARSLFSLAHAFAYRMPASS